MYPFDNAVLATADHLTSFLSQYYQGGAVIPGEVLVRSMLPKDDPRHADFGLVFRNNRLLEISVVPVPWTFLMLLALWSPVSMQI